ncbi:MULTISPECIES: pyridoxamine 5'-phosphate oxidase family protein [Halorussus]|uniref:pyridoxamine 5'-phosphate oxidase family protein n=1 Tax=Halorussus TaxID=1070314 RepID=UPI00209D24C7|nr:pyridoxamine 5'-phosphate oxidase family protein [Halorussus vallis]USZ78162.1 pyridoxamine 5'-phosphate oxidase family protein [Halorussus vallis]
MSDDAPDSVSDDVRYAPRAVDDEEWTSAFLRRRPAGVLGLVDDGAPYVVTQLFAYDEDEHAVFFHGANEGKTKRIVERSDRASFTVNEMGRLLPAEKPVNFDVEYESVVAFGRI